MERNERLELLKRRLSILKMRNKENVGVRRKIEREIRKLEQA